MTFSNEIKDNIFKIKVSEFLAEEDKRKFEGKRYPDLKFFDGTNMNYWFNNNKVFILTSDDEKCQEIVEQFLLYKGNHKLSFKQKLYIFEKEESLFKFNEEKIHLIFKDNVPMSEWFYNNKQRILKESELVRIQYLIFTNGKIDGYTKRVYTDKDFEIYKKYKNLNK